jgi:hypothetical protein
MDLEIRRSANQKDDRERPGRRGFVTIGWLLHCLDRDAADLMGRNKYAASSKGGPHKASNP